MARGTVRVWDRMVRLLHWGLVLSLTVSWLGTFALAGVHQPAGCVALALATLRLLWGFAGSPHARFAQFVCGPGATGSHLVAVLQRREPRHIGHNPLGAWMTLTLLACVGALALTGWLYTTTDRFWGDEGVEMLHLVLAWALLALVCLHLAGVLHAGRRQHESLLAGEDQRAQAPPRLTRPAQEP